MLNMLRHALSILLLPVLVVVAMPYWLLTTFPHGWSGSALVVGLLRAAGAIILIVGFLLFSWCVTLFAKVGRGTLAPWDPTQHLVASGPYRYVRNPMITGVALILFGLALLWGSWPLGLWATVFVVVNHVYFVFSEEPGLESRFGENYRTYKSNVPRWIPRLKPPPEK